ncbi:MAG: amidohydrolase [Alsobacter sp.]
MCRGCFASLSAFSQMFEGGADALGVLEQPQATRRGFMRFSAAAAAATAALTSPRRSFAAEGGAETIFRGGVVIPMAGSQRYVQALAIAGGKIVGVGSEAAVMGLRTPSTKIVDLGGRVLLPGFVDPHHHTILAAVVFELLTDVGFEVNPTRAKLIDALRAMASRTPPGQWILASNFDNLLQGGDLSREELDGVSTTHPIFVWYTNGHDACINSMAFKAAGIPDDIGPLPGGGRFERDANGQFTGMVFEESAMLKVVSKAMPKITPTLAIKAVNDYLKTAASTGNTTVHEPGTIRSEWITPFSKFTNEAACRCSASVMQEDLKGLEPFRQYGVGARATQIPNSLFTLYGVKIVGDGSNQTRTGAQTKPYLDSTDKGTPNLDAAQMKEAVASVKAAGWPVMIHCNGDYTIDIALDAIEAAYGKSQALGINRIEHSTMVRPDQLARMKALGVEPSFLMNHVGLYGAAYRDQLFGPERTAFMDPAGACLKAGIPFTLHTDSPCSPPGPLRLIGTAVTRRCDFDNSIIGKDQAIPVGEALKAVTINAARQIGMADRIGSLEVGKEADLTILEADPYKVDPDRIAGIPVSETWVAGRRKFG